jgi:pimeloyl-ACP methyl ester carboxylesterase
MNFVQVGSGTPVVLIHGLGASLFSWRDTVPKLSKYFTTYAIDLLGFGDSPAPTCFTIQAQVAAVGKFIAEQKLKEPIIIGHSMGGTISLQLAVDASKNIAPKLSKLVLIAPAAPSPATAPPISPSEITAILQSPDRGRELAKKFLAKAYAPTSPVTPAIVEGYAKGLSSETQIEALRKHAVNLGTFSFEKDTLETVATETLIVWGEQDAIVPPDEIVPSSGQGRAETLRGRLSNSTVKRINQCGHVPQEEKFTKTNELLSDFLK